MDWDYFLSDGEFKAKRLPKSTKGVRIKDITDLYDLRSYLRGTYSIAESIKAYQLCFDDPFSYDIEIDSFYDHFRKNSNNFLGHASKLKGKYEIMDQFIYWKDYYKEGEWIFLDAGITKQLNKLGVIEKKTDVSDDDWVMYLKGKYRVQDFKDIAKNNSIVLKGNKDNMARQFLRHIKNGDIAHQAPVPLKPGNGFNDWFLKLQTRYVGEVEIALAGFDYPKVYVEAVWDMVESDNSQYQLICELAREKKNRKRIVRIANVNVSKKRRKRPVLQVDKKNNNRLEEDTNLSPIEIIVGFVFSALVIWLCAKYLI